jgi:hypothetical protein
MVVDWTPFFAEVVSTEDRRRREKRMLRPTEVNKHNPLNSFLTTGKFLTVDRL